MEIGVVSSLDMVRSTLLLIALATLSNAIQSLHSDHARRAFSASPIPSSDACGQIAASVSAASKVFTIGSFNYDVDVSHWASSSSQKANCSFEPGSPEDVGVALGILGKTRTPFAVKGGGHTANPGFSSTKGVQISMSRFSDIVYDSMTQTVMVGAGLIWDDIYDALEPYGVNVVGGRVPGVGVAGFTLGGGYSWLTNQYGLTLDTVQAYELIMPNGTAINVTETSSPDLFFALKGGMNNFGIVTRFTLKTFPQTQVWAGMIVYLASVVDQVNLAVANFAANVTDAKAAMIPSYEYVLGQLSVVLMVFYDAPTQPGVFDEFLAIPSVLQDVSTRSFSSFVHSLPSNSTYGTRGIFNSVSVTGYPLSLIQSIANETMYWGENLALKSAFLISYNVEPFLPTLLTHNTSSTAYPPDRSKGYLPFDLYFSWELPEYDQLFQDAVRKSVQTLKSQAVAAGQSDVANAAIYPNYAIFDTPVADLYGANLARLQAIKAAVDPENVMGLAGGFKL